MATALDIKTGNYTIEQIDEHLWNIANVIKYGKKRNRKDCIVKADYWLDKRNEVVNS